MRGMNWTRLAMAWLILVEPNLPMMGLFPSPSVSQRMRPVTISKIGPVHAAPECGECRSSGGFGPMGPEMHIVTGEACGATNDDGSAAGGPSAADAAAPRAEKVEESAGCYDCRSWNACHQNDQAGKCWEWHDPCGSLELLHDLLALHDPSAVRNVLASPSSRVRLLPARGVLAVLDCGGRLIGYRSVS